MIVRLVATNEWRTAIEKIAGPRTFKDTRQSWLERAAQRANITHRQAKSLFYGECCDPKSSLAEKIKEAERTALSEAFLLANQLQTTAERLNEANADFYKPDINSLLRAARTLRGEN